MQLKLLLPFLNRLKTISKSIRRTSKPAAEKSARFIFLHILLFKKIISVIIF